MKIINCLTWFPHSFLNTCLILLFCFPSVLSCLGTGKEPELTVGSSRGVRVKLCGQLWFEGTSGAKWPLNVPILWSCLEEDDLYWLGIQSLLVGHSWSLLYDGISLRLPHCHDGIYQGDGDLAHCDFVSFTYLPSWTVMSFVVCK